MDEMTEPQPELIQETTLDVDSTQANLPTLLELLPNFAKIEGWLTIQEAEVLFSYAEQVKTDCIVEIGSYRGRGTAALCAGTSVGSQVPVFAIDPHEPFVGVKGGTFGPSDRRAFFRAMLNTKLDNYVRLLNTTSLVMAGGWDKKVALLLIDGDRRVEAVHADLAAWMRHLTDGALVIFKDPEEEGPAEVILEFSCNNVLIPERQVGALAIFKFDRQASLFQATANGQSLTASGERNIKKIYRDQVQADLTADTVAYHLYYGGNGKYLYQPIPKCACTSIKATLLELEGLPVDADEELLHKKAKNKFPGIMRLSPEEREDIYQGRTDTFKFVVARDPYTRMASAYRDKILMPEKNAWHWIEQIQRSAEEQAVVLSEQISFDEFVRVASAQTVEAMDAHWRPQFFEGRFGIIKFDYIARMEMLSSDLLYVMERIGAPEHLKQAASKPQNVTGADLAMWSTVSREAQSAFLKTYEIDFDTLHYPMRTQMTF